MLSRFLIGVGVWSMVCGIVAIPSWALSETASPDGKLIGIGLWVMIYATLTATDHFAARWRKRRERTAMLITYGGRMLVSAGGMMMPHLMFVDMICGIFSVGIVQNITRIDVTNHPDAILATAVTTFLQGLFLGVLTFIALLVIRAICLAVMKPDATDQPARGFEVLPVMPVTPADPHSPRKGD
jgi:hypothetical protein